MLKSKKKPKQKPINNSICCLDIFDESTHTNSAEKKKVVKTSCVSVKNNVSVVAEK